MTKIKTFELDRWSEPDEKRRVRHIGMADAKETFDRLQTHLELKGLLPDEYFLFSDELTGELPEFDQALCIPNFGASEGIYLDISLACRDKVGKRYFQNFATGKTLGETADDYVADLMKYCPEHIVDQVMEHQDALLRRLGTDYLTVIAYMPYEEDGGTKYA